MCIFRSCLVVFTVGETSLRRISLSAQRHCAEYLCTPPDVAFTSSEISPPLLEHYSHLPTYYAAMQWLTANLACRGPPKLPCKLRNSGTSETSLIGTGIVIHDREKSAIARVRATGMLWHVCCMHPSVHTSLALSPSASREASQLS